MGSDPSDRTDRQLQDLNSPQIKNTKTRVFLFQLTLFLHITSQQTSVSSFVHDWIFLCLYVLYVLNQVSWFNFCPPGFIRHISRVKPRSWENKLFLEKVFKYTELYWNKTVKQFKHYVSHTELISYLFCSRLVHDDVDCETKSTWKPLNNQNSHTHSNIPLQDNKTKTDPSKGLKRFNISSFKHIKTRESWSLIPQRWIQSVTPGNKTLPEAGGNQVDWGITDQTQLTLKSQTVSDKTSLQQHDRWLTAVLTLLKKESSFYKEHHKHTPVSGFKLLVSV